MNLAQAFGAGPTIAWIWFSLGRLFTFSCVKGQRVSLALCFPGSWHRAWRIPVIATWCFVKSQMHEHVTGWMMKRCVCLNSSNPKLIQLLIFLSPCTSLRAILFHFQLLTSLHFSLAYFVDVVLTFLKDPVPWGKSPPLVLYFCSLQIIWPRVEHKLLLSPWLKNMLFPHSRVMMIKSIPE